MSCISFNNFGESERYYNVSGKVKLQDKSMTEFKLNLTTLAELIKIIQSKINFIEKNSTDFKKEINSNEIKELREASSSLNKNVESSLKALDVFK